MRKNSYSFFAQDDFKVSSRLTLNLGLRYELNLPPTEKYGRWSNFIPDKNVIAIASDSAASQPHSTIGCGKPDGQGGAGERSRLPESLVYADKNGFAPRLGVAWRPFGGNKTSVRAGWGMFYGQDYLAPYYTYMGGTYPFQLSQTFSRLTTDPTLLTLANPFPASRAAFGGTTNISGIQLHMSLPRVQNYTLTIEHQISGKTAIEVAYSGSVGRKLSRAWDINQPYYYQSQFWGPNNTIPRPYAGWGSITEVSYGSLSNYNAGLFSIRRQMGHGLMFRSTTPTAKRWTRRLSIRLPRLAVSAACRMPAIGLSNTAAPISTRGTCIASNFTWQSPFQHSKLGRGWQLAGTGRGSSGFPITPATSAANLALGQAPRPAGFVPVRYRILCHSAGSTQPALRPYRAAHFVPAIPGAASSMDPDSKRSISHFPEHSSSANGSRCSSAMRSSTCETTRISSRRT